MRKVLIPTKLDKFAASMLSDRGYDVVLETALSLDEAVKANPDAEVLIVRSEKITPEIIDQLRSEILTVKIHDLISELKDHSYSDDEIWQCIKKELKLNDGK